MLMGQTQRLRTAADQMDKALRGKYDAINPSTVPPLLRDAADTIEDLRKTLSRKDDALVALQRDYNNQIKRIRNQRNQLRETQAALERETCHTVSMDCFGNPPYNKSGLQGNDVACGCSECGAPWSITGLFRGNKLSHNFKACPICGRKVVE